MALCHLFLFSQTPGLCLADPTAAVIDSAKAIDDLQLGT
jgi:hypothetical protein